MVRCPSTHTKPSQRPYVPSAVRAWAEFAASRVVGLAVQSASAACCVCAAQDAYGGFNSSRVVDDYVYYADQVFSQLGRFVKTWITFNEPLVTCDMGFKGGEHTPHTLGTTIHNSGTAAPGFYPCGFWKIALLDTAVT